MQTNEDLIHPVKVKLYQGGNLEQQCIFYNGGYSFNTDLNTYTVEIDTADLPFLLTCPSSIDTTVNVTVADSLVTDIDYAFNCYPGYDIGAWNVHSNLSFFPGNIAHINFSAGNVVTCFYNGGASTCSSPAMSGQVMAILTGPATYNGPLSGSLIPSSVSGDTIIWNIPDFNLLNCTNSFAFSVYVNTSANSGDPLCLEIIVSPDAGDNHISNNHFIHCFQVVNSYDPNEKEVSPVGSLVYPFNDWLTYTIHFQNTGTAPAQHIQVLDTLDADLDASTFQLLSYSHAPMVQLFGSNVKFNFPNINLPDSTTDAEASKGYVSYRVKPLANLPLGTTIENTASIYFDFNSPIVTNTVSNIICNPIAPTNISQTICAGDSYNFNGTTISTAGNYSATFNAINGCDSVVNLNLTVLNAASNTLTENICSGDIYNFNGLNISSTGIYFDTLAAINTCDSIITLNLTVETINTTIQQSSDTLSVTSSGSIQWIDCNSQQLISGANGNIFVATMSGNYAAIITEGNCIDTTSCTQVFTSANELTIDHSQFTIFPNPTDENITIEFSQPCENCRIEISNTLGQILLTEKLNQNSEILNLKSFSSGLYFCIIKDDSGKMYQKKLVIEK
ncbi:hypothetical protein LBMAG27_14930 [Bacteroidota bacterium]|nr:hypothetical protein LBMAG27_14930 [Bacteroidota bacterium]